MRWRVWRCDEVDSLEGDEVESLEADEMESSDIDEADDLEGEVVEDLVEKMDHSGDEVEGLGDEIEGLVDEEENFGDDVESLGNDEVACSLADDTEGVKDVQMEGKEQEFESTRGRGAPLSHPPRGTPPFNFGRCTFYSLPTAGEYTL